MIGATHAVGETITVLRPMVRSRGRRNTATTKGILLTAIGNSIRSVNGGVISMMVTYGNCRVVSLNIVIPTRAVMRRTVRRGMSVVKLDNLVAPSLSRVIRMTVRLRGTNLSIPLLVNNTAASPLRATLGVTPICRTPMVRLGSTSRGTAMTTGLVGPGAGRRLRRRLRRGCQRLYRGGQRGRIAAISLRRTEGGGLGLFWVKEGVEVESWSLVPVFLSSSYVTQDIAWCPLQDCGFRYRKGDHFYEQNQ